MKKVVIAIAQKTGKHSLRIWLPYWSSTQRYPEFIDRLKAISEIYELDFVVSVSAEKEEMIGVNFDGCEILN